MGTYLNPGNSGFERILKNYYVDKTGIIELKWNETAESAIEQIKNKKYPSLLENYVGEMVMVGINYNEKTKEHSCRIERIDV